MARALVATGDRWTLMIVLALAPGGMRLTHLHHRLPGVSAGVLERYVRQMVELGLLTRVRFKERPPRVELELTKAGRELVPVAGALARWGMRNRWSAPSRRERVEIAMLLRIMPVLLEDHRRLREGWVEAVVAGTDPPVRRLYRVHGGCLHLADYAEGGDGRPPGHIDGHRQVDRLRHRGDGDLRQPGRWRKRTTVRIEGDERAWVAALGPGADHSHLRFSGDKRLAREIFAALPR